MNRRSQNANLSPIVDSDPNILGLAMAGMRAGYWVFVVSFKSVVALAMLATVGAWLLAR
jgi:hypothetical protein